MMRASVIIVVVIVALSCTMETGRTEEDILNDIATNFVYVSDGDIDEWQTFNEIYASWEGDCEDIVTLYLGMVYRETGKKRRGVIIGKEGIFCHAVVETPIVDYLLTPLQPSAIFTWYDVLLNLSYDEWMLKTYFN